MTLAREPSRSALDRLHAFAKACCAIEQQTLSFEPDASLASQPPRLKYFSGARFTASSSNRQHCPLHRKLSRRASDTHLKCGGASCFVPSPNLVRLVASTPQRAQLGESNTSSSHQTKRERAVHGLRPNQNFHAFLSKLFVQFGLRASPTTHAAQIPVYLSKVYGPFERVERFGLKVGGWRNARKLSGSSRNRHRSRSYVAVAKLKQPTRSEETKGVQPKQSEVSKPLSGAPEREKRVP